MAENLSTEVTIPVKHLKVVVNRPFDQVRDAFQATLSDLRQHLGARHPPLGNAVI